MLQLAHFDNCEIGLRGKCGASLHAQLAGKEQKAQIKKTGKGEKDTGVYENTCLFCFLLSDSQTKPQEPQSCY